VFSDENYARRSAIERRPSTAAANAREPISLVVRRHWYFSAACNSCGVAVSVQSDRGAWVVRWRDVSGRQRGRRFASEADARSFDSQVHSVAVEERHADESPQGRGVYRYLTRNGARWYFKTRGRDGSQITRRGFLSEKAAIEAKRHIVEQVARGEASYTQETFPEYWERWLRRRRHHLAPASIAAYTVDARTRLLPALGQTRLAAIETRHVLGLFEQLAERVQAGELAGKTVNNTLTTLTVCLNDAVKDGLIATNPAIGVPRFPQAHTERDYLRLHEIPVYLDSCSTEYEPLAALLVGTGARISEALAIRPSDLKLDTTGEWVTIARALKQDGTIGSTKSRRARSVEIGPKLARRLENHLAERQHVYPEANDAGSLFIAPHRGRRKQAARSTSSRELLPPDRRTVGGWHAQTLQSAALRHMPLHSLRHTAAAAWLAAGNSLLYVQQQLGHHDLSTTSNYYGHLERHHNPTRGAHATEQAITRTSPN
jgi:integrase